MATGICLVVERDPIITAKQVASVDRLSGGRFLFGVGAGWNLEEMRNHGTDPSKRFGVLRERVEAMKVIWTEDEPEYHGRYVDFDPIWCWPKPLQKPHPPVLLGGHGRTVGDRVHRVRRRVAGQQLRGRRQDDRPDRADDPPRRARRPVARSGSRFRSRPIDPAGIERYAEAGVHRCCWYLPSAGPR